MSQKVNYGQPYNNVLKTITDLKCSQVSLDALVLPLEGLNAGQVLAKVVARQDRILLRDPGDGLISIPK